MSVISNKIRAYVNDFSVSNHYGEWGALRPDQRNKIRELCDTCDMFEETADKCYKENQALKEELKLLKGGCGTVLKCEKCKYLKEGVCTLYNGSQTIKNQWGGCWFGTPQNDEVRE